MTKGDDNTETFGLEIDDSDTVVFQVRDANGNRFDVSDGIYKNEWLHLAGTYDGDGNTVSCCVNGQLVDSRDDADFVSMGITLSQNTGGLAIGNRSDANDRWFEGNVDDLRVYNYALSAAEVAYIATDGTGYVPLTSQTNLYNKEPVGEQAINFRDFTALLESWLQEKLWPSQ